MKANWESAAEAVGGVVTAGDGGGDGSVRIEAPVPFDREDPGAGAWTVTMDDYATVVPAGKVMIPVRYARARAAFLTTDGLRLAVYRASVFSRVAAFLGAQDVAIDDGDFDRRYVVQSSRPEQARALLGGADGAPLRAAITAVPDLHLFVTDDGRTLFTSGGVAGARGGALPEAVDLLYAYSSTVSVAAEARAFYDVLAETLLGLAHLGTVLRLDPGVRP